VCFCANNNLHFINLFARQITTHNGRYLREDFSTLHHIVIACESTMKRLTTLLFADKQLLTFPNPQKRLGEKRDLRSSWRNRGGARRTFHSRRRASSAGFYKRLHLHVATSSSSCHCRDIIVSGVTAIGTCERAAGEENVGHLPRGCH